MATQTVLRQKIYEQIKQDIITCALSPGEPVSDIQFAERFHVSKTPIREALTSLVQEGLVEYTPNHGFRVTSISVRDIQEIFEARIIYETMLIRMVIKTISDEEINHLQGFVVSPREKTVETRPVPSPGENLNFHLALASAAHNSRLYRHYANLLNEAQRLFYMDFVKHSQTSDWGSGHEKILAALHNRDEQAAIVALEETLQEARKRVLGI